MDVCTLLLNMQKCLFSCDILPPLLSVQIKDLPQKIYTKCSSHMFFSLKKVHYSETVFNLFPVLQLFNAQKVFIHIFDRGKCR